MISNFDSDSRTGAMTVELGGAVMNTNSEQSTDKTRSGALCRIIGMLFSTTIVDRVLAHFQLIPTSLSVLHLWHDGLQGTDIRKKSAD